MEEMYFENTKQKLNQSPVGCGTFAELAANS